MPILSEGLWEMNSIAMSFEALIRSGVRSLASILVETSIASTMSIPSVSILSISVEDLGRAMAITIMTRAKVLSRNGRCLSTAMNDVPETIQGTEEDTLR